MRTGGVTRSVSPDGCRASMLPWRHLFLFVLLWRADLSESGCIHYLKDLSLAGNRPNNTLMLVDVVTPRISKDTAECTLERLCNTLGEDSVACYMLEDCFREKEVHQTNCETTKSEPEKVSLFHLNCMIVKVLKEDVPGCITETFCQDFKETSVTTDSPSTSVTKQEPTPTTTTTTTSATTTATPTTSKTSTITTTISTRKRPPVKSASDASVTRGALESVPEKLQDHETVTRKVLLPISVIINLLLLASCLYLIYLRRKEQRCSHYRVQSDRSPAASDMTIVLQVATAPPTASASPEMVGLMKLHSHTSISDKSSGC